jgi:hypothetical protein
MNAIKFLATLVLAGALIFAPTQVTAKHNERGCKTAPAKYEIPHWVQNDLCLPKGHDPHVYAVLGEYQGQVHAYLGFYLSRAGYEVGDPDSWIGTGVFVWSVETRELGRMVYYQSNMGKVYMSHKPTGIQM